MLQSQLRAFSSPSQMLSLCQRLQEHGVSAVWPTQDDKGSELWHAAAHYAGAVPQHFHDQVLQRRCQIARRRVGRLFL
jgi:hypothetical protein